MGIAIRPTIVKSILLVIAVIALAVTDSQSAGAVTAALDSSSPKAGNSAPDGIFHHRIRYNQLGQHNDVKLDVYMDASTQKTIRINREFCDTNLNAGVGQNTNILRVTMVGATNPPPINISAANLCDVSASGLFRNYTLPLPQYNGALQKYFVSLTIEYINPLGFLNKNNTATDRNAIGFTVNVVNSSTTKLAPVSTGGRNYSVLANSTGGNSSFRIPFALPCGTPADGNRKSIKIYDADVTDLFGQLEVEVFKKGTDEAVQLYRNAETIGTIVNGNKFVAGPGAGNRENTGFDFVPATGQKYVIKISNLYNGNTIDIGMPNGMDTIYGAIPCPIPGQDVPTPTAYASITPVAAISQSDIEPGEQTSGLGYAAVENFPDLYAGDYPYTEVAIQNAENTNQNATRVTYNAQQGEEAVNQDATKQIQCADGAYRAPVNCADLGTYQCNDNVDRDNCGTYNWQCEKTAAAGGGYNNFNDSSKTRAGISRPANCRNADQYYDIQCADGVYRNPNNCADLGTFQCNDNVDRDACSTYNWECTWNSDIRYVNHGANTQSGMDSCRIFKYYCKDTNGNYISSGDNYQYRTMSGLERAECNNKWDCPAPSPVVGFGADDASAPCKIFKCAVYTDVSYGTWYEPAGVGEANKRCDFRCGGGTSTTGPNNGHAWLATAGPQGKWNEGDLNCYYAPTFTIVCNIFNGSTTTTVSETVTGNGSWCSRNLVVQGPANIGGQVCVTTSVSSPTNGAGWGGPGLANSQPWVFSVGGPDSDCVTVVSKPTFKVLGGDVSAGATFASNTCTNDFSNSSIVGWSGSATGYNGSYTEFGALAPGSVYSFASSKRQGNVPNGLTFANTNVSGERFGGDFGPMPCITDHAGMKPTNPSSIGSLVPNSLASGSYTYSSNNIANSPTIDKSKQITLYKDDDLRISSNIRYDRSTWNNVDEIPALKVVVTGDIYIEAGVTELNGVYVAQPKSDGTGGRIYTCADVANSASFSGCNQTLTVNGAFIAKQVVLGRTFGTQRQGSTAEVFRYLPELWLTKWPQGASTNSMRYDSMTNLAPIL